MCLKFEKFEALCAYKPRAYKKKSVLMLILLVKKTENPKIESGKDLFFYFINQLGRGKNAHYA